MSRIASWSTMWLGELPCRYGAMPELGRHHGGLDAVLVANHGGFRLQLTAFVRAKEKSPLLPRADAIGVALINGTRRHEVATDEEPFSTGIGNGHVTQQSETWQLPWPDDPLADTWLAIRIDDATYSIELPYGVCRDEALAVSACTPAPAAAPAGIARRWCKLEYDSEAVGELRVRLYALPEAPGVLDVELYRHDVPRWSPPPVAVSLAVPGHAATVKGRQIGDWHTPDSMRRRASFAVAPVARGRHFAEVTVHVGPFRHAVVVPSSLLVA